MLLKIYSIVEMSQNSLLTLLQLILPNCSLDKEMNALKCFVELVSSASPVIMEF